MAAWHGVMERRQRGGGWRGVKWPEARHRRKRNGEAENMVMANSLCGASAFVTAAMTAHASRSACCRLPAAASAAQGDGGGGRRMFETAVKSVRAASFANITPSQNAARRRGRLA